MDGKISIEKKNNPRERANIFNALTYGWVARIFRLGFKRDLELDDFYEPLNEHKSSIIGHKLSIAWENEVERCNKKYKNRKNNPSLTRVFLKVFGGRIALYGFILFIVEVFVRILQPFALGRFLRYFSDDDMSKMEAYLYALGLILTSFTHLLFAHTYWMAATHMSMKMRVACCSLIYRKALRLSKSALDNATIGQVMNLLSNDGTRFDSVFAGLHYLWIGPLQTIVTTYFMYEEVGLAAIYGIIVLLLFIPLQLWLGKKTSILRLSTAIRTDERVGLTSEIIKGIQSIKMYTWENLFRDIIKKARKNEINVIRYTGYVKSVVISFSMFISRLSLFVTILIYILSGDTISTEKVFMLTAFYANLQQTMAIHFPYEVTKLAEMNVSIKRVEQYLMYDEIKSQKLITSKDNENKNIENQIIIKNNDKLDNGIVNDNESKSSVIFDNVHAKWLINDCDNILNGVNINIKSGEIVAVIGRVGSGKSSLLNVILNELPVTNGKIIVSDKISYASQEPWLFSGTVRQNILFGKPMDHQKYRHVIKVCQLKRDFTLLPYGDKTIVGERGLSLSGGQKARINLARAVYNDASLYIFDDPLSAVDAHVGKCLFEECIRNYLHGRTRIIVTHQIQFLRHVNKIIVLENGGVIAEGTYDQLINMGMDIGALDQGINDEIGNNITSYSRSNSRRSNTSLDSFPSNSMTNYKQNEPKEVDETRTRGNISGQVYRAYINAGGNCCVIFMILLLYIIAQFSASGTDWFLAYWTKLEENSQIIEENNNMINDTIIVSNEFVSILSSRITCIYIFGGLIAMTIFMSIIKSFIFLEICMRASKRLHDAMFYCISRATMKFFNTNTSARILNRFTKDMGIIDELLPAVFIDCIQIGLAMLGIVIVVAISNPWLLIPTAIISILLYICRVIYVATSRSVKRLEGISRSSVYNHFLATLQGLTTIRSFGTNKILIDEFDHHQDNHSSVWYIFIVSSRAFAFWLDCLNLIYTVIVTMSFLILPKNSNFSHGTNVGLAITQCLGLTGELQWGMRQVAELENQMTSVERVKEYTNIESEPPLKSHPDKKPLNDWPQQARIEFKNVYLSYGPMELPVLKNINFVINSRERVGIVGRTGAGKSSIISALFRLADIRGIIDIDGIDTGEIGLHDLRSKIGIIPQEPFLFSGSLRQNLDPFHEHQDNELWTALEDVELKEMGLEMFISDGGGNLSVGQRQLICLARAIVKKNKILILDEATANVDSHTDDFIQVTIRKKFSDCTLLTIAHRLNTIMDNDRILVMDAGNVVEFDHPYILLKNDNGFLSKMVKKTGEAMAEKLTRVAKENYESRQFTSITAL
ncbi:hypothetical protein PV326_000289 [Microctonus aethiopoides]|nr:hypothetical protein PV326_000289 [Microctonus aethiopoides]